MKRPMESCYCLKTDISSLFFLKLIYIVRTEKGQPRPKYIFKKGDGGDVLFDEGIFGSNYPMAARLISDLLS